MGAPSSEEGKKARVRASTVRVRDQFVLARYGKLSRERYREFASPALLQVLTTPGDVWVDFEHFIEATELACRLFGDGTSKRAREIGAYGAEANMGPWRSMVHRLLSPKIIFEIAGMLWSHHYDSGRLTTTSPGDREVIVRIEDFPTPHVMHCASIEGWYERTLLFSKPRKVTVRQTACRVSGDPYCAFHGRWE